MEELLRCTCGIKPRICQLRSDGFVKFFIMCFNDECKLQPFTSEFSKRETAINIWNRDIKWMKKK